MQASRHFEIIYILLHKTKATASELAAHFEVSERTILRDIEALSMAGIPVYAARGRGGGICLQPQFVLNKALLSDEEQGQILMALQSQAATGQAGAGDILPKLEALFRKNSADWLEVDFSRWGQGGADNARFALLKEAVLAHRAIGFTYVGSYGTREARRVYPLKLVFKSRAWYAQCFCLCRQAYRTFKLSRMLGVRLLDEHFTAEAYSPPPIDTDESSGESLVSVELAFPAKVAYRVYDEFDEGSVRAADDGFLYVTARLPEDGWLYSFLLSFGGDVQVLQPTHV